jgi:putative acetyltransferase
VLLKDGQEGTLRPATLDDGGAVYDIERAIVAGGVGVVRTLASMPPREIFVQQYQHILPTGFQGASGISLLGCLGDGTAGANGTLKRLGPDLVNHVALLSVGVHPDHQGLGLGRWVMRGLLDWAAQVDIKRIELYVRADNDRAINLYQSLGFVTEGRRRNFHRTPQGELRDDLIMALLRP